MSFAHSLMWASFFLGFETVSLAIKIVLDAGTASLPVGSGARGKKQSSIFDSSAKEIKTMTVSYCYRDGIEVKPLLNLRLAGCFMRCNFTSLRPLTVISGCSKSSRRILKRRLYFRTQTLYQWTLERLIRISFYQIAQ